MRQYQVSKSHAGLAIGVAFIKTTRRQSFKAQQDRILSQCSGPKNVKLVKLSIYEGLWFSNDHFCS